MNLSISLDSDLGDKYYVYLAQLDGVFEDDLHYQKKGVEIYEVVLDRKSGDNKTNVRILSQIVSFIAKQFLANKNLILYYICDDMNEIPTQAHDLSPQAYRSRIFSALFERYVHLHNITNIIDTTISFKDAVGQYQYIHIISRDTQSSFVEILEEFILTGYASGK